MASVYKADLFVSAGVMRINQPGLNIISFNHLHRHLRKYALSHAIQPFCPSDTLFFFFDMYLSWKFYDYACEKYTIHNNGGYFK